MMATAICLRDIRKSYLKNEPVLDGLNMTVSAGTIYVLLGASGCGKTTLLTILTGLLKQDSGTVSIFGLDRLLPSSFGYMPQMASVMENLTISENMYFFGRVFGLSNEEIKKKMEFFTQVFLPSSHNERVSSLSGGQQRRLSLAIALIHDPQLLLLDEPTVGLDPVLKDDVWQFLLELNRTRRTTILITTQYNEDALKGHAMGFIRKGVMLRENSPQTLMAQFRCRDLTDLLEVLCVSQEDGSLEHMGPSPPVEFEQVQEKPKQSKMKILRATIIKNFGVLFNNPSYICLVFGLLVASFLIAHFYVGHLVQDMKLTVVNMETANCADFEAVSDSLPCSSNNLSCYFLRGINTKYISLENVKSFKIGKDYVLQGKAWGVLELDENFTDLFLKRLHLNGSDGISEINRAVRSEIVVTLDQTSSVVTTELKYFIWNNYESFSRLVLNSCSPDDTFRPGFMNVTKLNNISTLNLGREKVAGLKVTGMSIYSLLLGGFAIFLEKSLTTWQRTTISGVKPIYKLLAHIAVCTPMVLGLAVLNHILSLICHLIHSYLATLALFLAGLNSMFIGLLSTSANDNFFSMIMILFGQTVFFGVTSGGIWPLEGAHPILKQVLRFLPHSRSSKLLFKITMQGRTLQDAEVVETFLGLLATLLLLFSVTIFKYLRM